MLKLTALSIKSQDKALNKALKEALNTTYKLSNELPKEMKQLLPEPEENARKLEELEG